MARSQITLYGDDSTRFEQLKEEVGEQRAGSEPSNAELVRVMMDELDTNEL